MSELVFVVPGRLDQLTGGSLYDRHVVDGLRARGRRVRVVELAADRPDAGGEALTAIADGAHTIIDGLALGHLGTAATRHAARLRLVALVHGPLALETGLPPAAAARAARIEAGLLARVRGVICPSRKTAAAIAGYGVPTGRIAIVPPGTAKPIRPPGPRRGPVRALLCVANLVPRKGHRVLIEALARVRHLDWTLLCIGSLERHRATARTVRRMIAAAHLGHRVTLAGEQPPEAVMRAYRAADAFVLPSFHEGYGMAFAEAMAHGLPVIGASAGAIPKPCRARPGSWSRPAIARPWRAPCGG